MSTKYRSKLQLSWILAVGTFLLGAVLLVFQGDQVPNAEASPGEKSESAPMEKPPNPGVEKTTEIPAEKQAADATHGSSEGAKTGSPAETAGVRKPAAATEDFQEGSSFSNAEAPEDGSLPSPAAISDVKKQREVLARRQKDLESKEEDLKKKEMALAGELEKLEGLRADISKLDEVRKKENDEKVVKLVETLETMSPKSASQLIATIDENLAVSAITKMTTPKLAKIMNIMDPVKSSRLTELMSGVISKRAGSAPATRTPASSGGRAPKNPPTQQDERPAEKVSEPKKVTPDQSSASPTSLSPASLSPQRTAGSPDPLANSAKGSKNYSERGGEKYDGKNTELSKSDEPIDGASEAVEPFQGSSSERKPASSDI